MVQHPLQGSGINQIGAQLAGLASRELTGLPEGRRIRFSARAMSMLHFVLVKAFPVETSKVSTDVRAIRH